MKNHTEIADLLWQIAALIKDDFEAQDYEDVILPFTLLRRLDCVLDFAQRMADNTDVTPPFTNHSGLSLAQLAQVPLAQLGASFACYLDGFSANIQDILLHFCGGRENGLGPLYQTLLRKRLLPKICQAFAAAQLDPVTVDNHAMGTIFEYLIRKFKEAGSEAAGQFYTPREIIQLMLALLFEPDRAQLLPEQPIALYDPACGTGGMLTLAKEYLLTEFAADLTVTLYGQEINEKTYALAKADLLLKGEPVEYIKCENTLSHDLLPEHHFNYMLSNPPFGKDWKNIREAITAEHARGEAGRFAPGLPDVGDGALLFLLHLLHKMAPPSAGGAKIAIVLNGSPLFAGQAGSGASNIRRYLLEQDYVDAIIALPIGLFYNTSIATYIWLLSNRKPAARRGRVQLINANQAAFCTPLRKNLGQKRVEITPEQIRAILAQYQAFTPSANSQIFATTDFCYTQIQVERPLRLRYDLSAEQRASLQTEKVYQQLPSERAAQLDRALDILARRAPWWDDGEWQRALAAELPFRLPQTLVRLLQTKLGMRDPAAAPVLVSAKPGAPAQLPLPDSLLRDNESVPFGMSIEHYFMERVLPYAPDAWLARDKDRFGAEIAFTRYFYQPPEQRSAAALAAELQALPPPSLPVLPPPTRSATYPRQPLKFCDPIIMGQSPAGEHIVELGSVGVSHGHLPFLQGNAEFGVLSPTATCLTTHPEKICQAGDLLLSVRAPVGAVNLADRTYAIGRGLCAIRPLAHDAGYLRYLLLTLAPTLQQLATGTTFAAVSVSDVANLPVSLPPLSVQRQIAADLDAQLAAIDQEIVLAQQRIALLHQYRAALLTETLQV